MSDLITSEQVKAARALLAWTQQELATKAQVATSTVADFERGSRTPVANNASAIKAALEAEGLRFMAGGVVEEGMLPQPPLARPGSLMRWVTATHLSQWGEMREGQSGMPDLLRRLIYAAVGPAEIRFPSDESVQYPGWDGICTSHCGNAFVPEGISVWEIGAQRTAIKAKAETDFEKRSADPLGVDPNQATYICVTPQRFVGKDDWVAEKRRLGIWRDVRVIDGDGLAHWLEMHPAVAQWLSTKIGRRPQGLRNMEEVWEEWSQATQTPFATDIVLVGRDEIQVDVLKWLRGPPQLFSLQAEAPDEALAFLYASISPMPEKYRLSYWSRCVVADDAETARQLIGLGTPLIIVLINPDAGLARRLVGDGHHVFAAYGPDVNTHSATRSLPRPWRHDLMVAMRQAGFSEEDAHRYAHASGRSITVLRRLMPAAPQHRAIWADRVPPELIAAMLAGSWSEASGQDREVVSKLADRPYEAVEEVLAPLAATVGGPIVRSGTIWKVVSLRDVWTQIGTQLTTVQLARFNAVFQKVFGSINPRFATRPKSPYYEDGGEYGEEPSVALRHGLTEALIAMAVFPERAALINDLAARVDGIVGTLFDNASPALWWSLSGDFRNLAEASPTAFLEALENGLSGDNPPVMSLFRSDEGFMHPTEYLSNLLWALEILARSPLYLLRSSMLLAQLANIDPGGRIGNRPFPSLRRIFVSWSPQTCARLPIRLKVIDRILGEYPEIGWKLLVALSPKFHDTSEPSSMPNWRDFSPDEEEEITWPLVAETAKAVGDRLLHNVGHKSERWHDLLGLWPNFSSPWREVAVEQLTLFVSGVKEPSVLEEVRDKIRSLVQQHRGFADAEWAMPEEDLKRLDQVFDMIQPQGVEERVRWLFRQGATHHRPDADWQTQQAELEKYQQDAAESLLSELNADQIFSFAKTITLQYALGIAIARTSSREAVKYALMRQGMLAEASSEKGVALGILHGMSIAAGAESVAWLHALWGRAINEGWGNQAEVYITLALPASKHTWHEIEQRSHDLANAYWAAINPYQIPDGNDHDYVVSRMLSVGRGCDAVDWLGLAIKREESVRGSLLTRTLREAAHSEPPAASNSASMFSYHVGEILNYLDNATDVEAQELVELEWLYFPVLRYSQRPPKTLHRALAKHPEFFVQLLKMIYLPAKDSGVVEPPLEDIEKAKGLAGQAWEVLHDWEIIPGTDSNGDLDGAALELWVTTARKLLAEAGRVDIGDSQIGNILCAAARKPDEPWPPVPVREIIELVRSRSLEQGFELGVYNRRGVTVRMPHDGGAQERILAERYRRDAEALRFDWPRTAACLERIADSYVRDARREDIDADQRDWL